MAKHVYVLIDPYGRAKFRARRPSVGPAETLVVIKCELSRGAVVELETRLAQPVEVQGDPT